LAFADDVNVCPGRGLHRGVSSARRCIGEGRPALDCVANAGMP
jgi:hypothetical protein